jgi:hypothetical protein
LPEGRALLAHEAWHSIQQTRHGGGDGATRRTSGRRPQRPRPLSPARPACVRPAPVTVQRQGFGEVRLAEHKAEVLARRPIRYTEAKAENERYARRFAFDTALATAGGGRYAGLAGLWKKGDYNAFADAVASLQFDFGLPERDNDGILGPTTSWRIAGLGPAMASVQVVNPDSEKLCYMATRSGCSAVRRWRPVARWRSRKAQRGQSSRSFSPPTRGGWPTSRRSTGEPARRRPGVLGPVRVRPGGRHLERRQARRRDAGVGEPQAYELLQAGSVKLKGGKTRPIVKTDADFYGTSSVFVKYEGKAIVVRHFGRTETHKESDFEVWIAANTK